MTREESISFLRRERCSDDEIVEALARGPLKPDHRTASPGTPSPDTAACAISFGIRLALAFPTRAPTVDELRSAFGVSRATAYRWRRAWLDAHGERAR